MGGLRQVLVAEQAVQWLQPRPQLGSTCAAEAACSSSAWLSARAMMGRHSLPWLLGICAVCASPGSSSVMVSLSGRGAVRAACIASCTHVDIGASV